MLPSAAKDMYWLLALVGIISILYGALVCLAQDDLKRLGRVLEREPYGIS